jgi:hypothetical protein
MHFDDLLTLTHKLIDLTPVHYTFLHSFIAFRIRSEHEGISSYPLVLVELVLGVILLTLQVIVILLHCRVDFISQAHDRLIGEKSSKVNK